MSTTTNLSTLKINYLTQAQYDAAAQVGTINQNELYFTPDSGGGGGGGSDITAITAGTGLSGGGSSGTVTLNHSNSVTAQTTQAVYPIKIDTQGHISEYGSAVTIPTISVSQSLSSGTQIGSITLNGTTTNFYAPSSSGVQIVQYTPNVETGVQLGTLDVDSNSYSIYVPARAFYQATNTSSATSIPSGTITQIPLTDSGAIFSGAGFSISEGGIQVTNAGVYQISGSLYLTNPSAATARGVYVYKGTSTFSAATEVYGNIYTDISGTTQAGALALGSRYIYLNAGDIIFLAGRIVGAAGSANASNASTFLSLTGMSEVTGSGYFYTGSSTPSSTTGSNGDIYLRVNS